MSYLTTLSAAKVTYRWWYMRTDHLWNNNDGNKLKYSEKTLSQCQLKYADRQVGRQAGRYIYIYICNVCRICKHVCMHVCMDRLSTTTEYLKRDILCSRRESRSAHPVYQCTSSRQHQPARVSGFMYGKHRIRMHSFRMACPVISIVVFLMNCMI
jgi:hypothetical protein